MTLFGYGSPAHQAWMVLDRVRTEAYARAISVVVRPGDVVLDIGTGSGVLAMLAAKAGARRVFAVERTRIHRLARTHVIEAELGHVVEVIHADLMDLSALPERPTLVVSEMLGHIAPDENMHALYRHARALSAPDVRMIPESYEIAYGLVDLPALTVDIAYLETGLTVPLRALSRQLLSTPKVFSVPETTLLTPEVFTRRYRSDDVTPTSFGGAVQVSRTGIANGIAVAFRSQLGPDVEIDTRSSAAMTHWRQVVFPIDAMTVERHEVVHVEVEPRVPSRYDSYRWSLRARAGVSSKDGLDGHGELSEVEFARALGLVPAVPEVHPSSKLKLWAAALAGEATSDFGTMLERVLAASPQAHLKDAREALFELLDSSGSLSERTPTTTE